MGMFDTVMHDGQEWQTKSIEPSLGGMMGDYEVKDSRLWLLPFHLEENEDTPTDPETDEPLSKWLAFNDRHRRVDDPLEDICFHGVLDIYRDLARISPESSCKLEYRRLIFVLGHLVSETPLAEDAEHTSGRWSGDYMPKDPNQKLVWQLHSLRGILKTINASSETPSAAVPALQQAESSISEALSHLEPQHASQ
jgi:hypothetical protein